MDITKIEKPKTKFKIKPKNRASEIENSKFENSKLKFEHENSKFENSKRKIQSSLEFVSEHTDKLLLLDVLRRARRLGLPSL